MAIDANTLIKNAESELTRRLVAPIVLRLVSASSFWFGPLSFILGIAVGYLVKYGDWVTFSLGNGWMNNAHAGEFQEKGEALENLPKTATKEERDAAKKAKDDAFDKLWGAS